MICSIFNLKNMKRFTILFQATTFGPDGWGNSGSMLIKTRLFLCAHFLFLKVKSITQILQAPWFVKNRLLQRQTHRKLKSIIFIEAIEIYWHPTRDLQTFLFVRG